MYNVRIRESCGGTLWSVELWKDNRCVLFGKWKMNKSHILKEAKGLAKKLKLKFNPKMIKEHGC